MNSFSDALTRPEGLVRLGARQMIKYLGSKRLLVPLISEVVGYLGNHGTVLDLFSGTSRVGHGLKAAGWRVLSNDHNAYAEVLARCYVQADKEDIERQARLLIEEFNRMPGVAGYATDTWCVRSRFFQPQNGERIDAIREAMVQKGLDPELEAVMLVSLMEAADRVDSTTGIQMAYLKQWAPRAFNRLELRLPDVLPRAASGKGSSFALDAFEAVDLLEADIAYVDPPYNQHKYLGNYHIWESLVRWDKPEVYGVACKRVDCRERQSPFNSRPEAPRAMYQLLQRIRARHIVLSFSDEGFLSREWLEEALADRGEVVVIERPFRRYVGARIGIYSPGGEKVGQVSHVNNREYLYVVTEDRAAATRLRLLTEDAPVRRAA